MLNTEHIRIVFYLNSKKHSRSTNNSMKRHCSSHVALATMIRVDLTRFNGKNRSLR